MSLAATSEQQVTKVRNLLWGGLVAVLLLVVCQRSNSRR